MDKGYVNRLVKPAAALLFIAFLGVFASAMKDPSQVYCESLGYRFITEEAGDEYTGFCVIGDQKIDSWKFIRGEASVEAGACAKKGQMLKVIKDPVKCWYTGTGECAACVQADGTEVEVTKLLNLNFLESSCGDGICGMPENHVTCPGDCKSAGADNLCDGVADGMCDPDCESGGDADCAGAPKTTLPTRKPVNEPQGGGNCIPLLLAPMAFAATLATRQFIA